MCRRRPKNLPPIISAQGLSKRYGVAPLFQNISFTVSEGDRIGVIGPNGSGKSTLLEMLVGRVRPDSGDVAIRKGTRLSTVAQVSEYAADATIRAVIEHALERSAVPETERASRFAETLGRAGDRKSTRLNSSHTVISYAVFCLKKKKYITDRNALHRTCH